MRRAMPSIRLPGARLHPLRAPAARAPLPCSAPAAAACRGVFCIGLRGSRADVRSPRDQSLYHARLSEEASQMQRRPAVLAVGSHQFRILADQLEHSFLARPPCRRRTRPARRPFRAAAPRCRFGRNISRPCKRPGPSRLSRPTMWRRRLSNASTLARSPARIASKNCWLIGLLRTTPAPGKLPRFSPVPKPDG